MRIAINPQTGAMEFEATPQEAVVLMRLQAEGAKPPRVPVSVETVPVEADAAGLTEPLYRTWKYLVAHENTKLGVTLSSLARHLRVTNPAAGFRVNKLIQLGYAERVSRGRYRAVCP